jgi:two-component system phosphate regulon response regulator PhoB
MTNRPRILIVEDESAIADLVAEYLRSHGYDCRCAPDAAAAEAALAHTPPDLVLLDWMLPDRSGYELARLWRSDPARSTLPLIMLTARMEESDKIRALDAGADDYVTKPFSLAELASRINALLRRARGAEVGGGIEIDGLHVDPDTRRVTAHGETVAMAPTEFDLLFFLARHPERVHSRAQLIGSVWRANVCVEDRTVDVHVRRLRKALAPSGHDRLVQTVRGSGYRLSTRE